MSLRQVTPHKNKKLLSSSATAFYKRNRPTTNRFHIRDWITLVNSVLDIGLKLAPLMLVLPAIALLRYLDTIGWPSLLLESVASPSGLSVVLVTCAFLAIAFIWLAVTPSFFLSAIPYMYAATFKVPKSIFIVLFSGVLIWLGGIGLATYQPKQFPPPVILIASLFLTMAISYFLRRELGVGMGNSTFQNVDTSAPKATPYSPLQATFAVSLLVWLSCLSTTFPLWLGTAVITPERTAIGEIKAVGFLALLSVVSLVPGAFYIHSRAHRTARDSAIKVAAISAIVIPYFWLYLAPSIVDSIIFASLRKIGVFEEQATSFFALKPEIQILFEKNGFPAEKAKGTFTGFTRFNFGDVRLLCTEAYRPLHHRKTDLDQAQNDLPGGLCVVVHRHEIRVINKTPNLNKQ